MKRISFFWLLLACLATQISNAVAQSTPEEIVVRFFKVFEEKGPNEAVDYVFSTNKWMARNQDGLQNLKNQLGTLINIIGQYYGHDEIISTWIGDRYLLTSYLVRYDRQPLRFTFLLYKPNEKWQIQNFRYDDKLDEELGEAAKLHRMTHKAN